jgi:hypothetical protein
LTHEAIAAANAGLPPPMREVLVLSEVERMSDAEIADVVGVAAEAVGLLVLRACGRLARALNCSPADALAVYREWPLAEPPLTSAEALSVARQRRNRSAFK